MAITFLKDPRIGMVRGFTSAGVRAGLKPSGNLDLAILCSDRPCAAAGVFTRNKVVAAPVVYDRMRLRREPVARAVVVNSGQANACTGPDGDKLVRTMVKTAASALDIPESQVLISSTGCICQLPPEDKLLKGIWAASARLNSTDKNFQRAIMTTDTVPKISGARFTLPGGRRATIVGCAKGAGMIAPNMATMLAFFVTDAAVDPAFLQRILREAADDSFNAISIDGDTSTNDTLLVLANGALGNPVIRSGAAAAAFAAALRAVTARVAERMVADGEGVTKVITIDVCGARSRASALRAARTVGESLLFKTAMHGGDPNVGRILGALGRSGVAELKADRIEVTIGGRPVILKGRLDPRFDRPALNALLKKDRIHLVIDLHAGATQARFITGDLSEEYVRFNADYTT